MSFMIRNLEVDISFLSEIETQNILDAQSIEDILVSPSQSLTWILNHTSRQTISTSLSGAYVFRKLGCQAIIWIIAHISTIFHHN